MYKLAFGTYDFPGTLRPVGGDGALDLGEQERPRADGSTSQIARKKSRTLTVRGDLIAGDPDTLQTLYDALKAACFADKQPLWFGRDDRWVLAQLESWTDDSEGGILFGIAPAISLSFRAVDPFFLATTPTTDVLAAGGGSVTPLGDADALPAWSITIGAAGTGPITLTNSTTGETATLSGTFGAGDVIVLTRGGYTVTLNGAANFGLLGGRIPKLIQGANTIVATAGGTATISGLSVTYTARYF